jgi:4-alpha-glucanotransferase
MTFPGVPCIYYGDEAGLRGTTDPHNRKTYPWGNENKEILNFYKEMIKLRNSDDVFVNGDFHSLYITDDIYAFTRSNDKKMVLIAINKSLEQKTCKLPFMEDELVLESMSWIIKEKLSIIRNCQAD